MLTHVRKIGNSAGIIIPAQLIKALNLKEGDALSIEEQEGKVVISLARPRPKYKLEDLLAQCDPNAPMGANQPCWGRNPMTVFPRGDIVEACLNPAPPRSHKINRNTPSILHSNIVLVIHNTQRAPYKSYS